MATVTLRSTRINEALGLLLLALTVVIGLSLISYHPQDPSSSAMTYRETPRNWVGPFGAYLSDALFQAFGLSAFLMPIALALIAWRRFRSQALEAPYVKGFGFLILLCSFAALLSLKAFRVPFDVNYSPGGIVGLISAALLIKHFNLGGSLIILATLISLALLVCTRFSFQGVVDWMEFQPRAILGWHRSRRERARLNKLNRGRAEINKAGFAPAAPKEPAVEAVRATATASARVEPMDIALRKMPAAGPPDPIPITLRQPPLPLTPAPSALETPSALVPPAARPVYSLPDIDFLMPASGHAVLDEPALRELAQKICQKYAEFGVLGNIVQIHPGPVVTTFEFKPEPGIKYSRIINLVDDICLAMKAESIRIDRIPGKATVGIEVPNEFRETINLRGLLESDAYRRSASKLTLALGKRINGDTYITDLAKMPHLLIAGATGTGKSVAVNSLITSILYKATPDEVKFILIDPKRLELGIYADIPHLLTPIVTEIKSAANTLNWAVAEMEERYKRLAFYSVRNIDQYNHLVRTQTTPKPFLDDEDTRPLPHLVVIVDELADLMLLAGRDVETSITRLAQMARAVGIHLILSTQRPSVDVITGLIKANFPCRISFRVSSKVDSRTILDCNGAEQLLGNGDMLFLPPVSARLIRLHGAYVSEREAERIISFLKAQAPPQYKEEILDFQKEEKKEESDELAAVSEDLNNADDPLYEEAVRVVVEMGKASTSVLQRRLKIGYGRAARLLDIMQHQGIVGPPDASKPREILVSRDYFREIDSRETFE